MKKVKRSVFEYTSYTRHAKADAELFGGYKGKNDQTNWNKYIESVSQGTNGVGDAQCIVSSERSCFSGVELVLALGNFRLVAILLL